VRGRAAALLVLCAAGCAGEAARGRPWVRHFQLQNVRQVDEKDLRGKLVMREASLFWWVPGVPRNYLDPFTFQTDQERIEAYYHARGFFSARVVSAEPVRRDNNSVDVHIAVDEGQPTKIRSVRVTGIAAPAGELAWALGHVHLEVGERFDHPVWLAQKESLAERLRSLGYAWAQVDGEVSIDRDRRTADLALRVTLGRRARFGVVKVRGAEKVDPAVVVRRADLPPGRVFDPAALDAARERVEGLRLFSSVTATWEHGGAPDVADVIFTVQEAPLRELRIGGGFGVEPQRVDAHLQVSHSWRNFLGGARTLRLQALGGWVFLAPLEKLQNGPIASVEAQIVQHDLPLPLSQLAWTIGWDLGIEYAFQYQGPRTQLGITQPFLSDRVRAGLSYNFQFLDLFSTDPSIQKIALDDPSRAGRLFGYHAPYLLGWYQGDLAIDLRDQALDPREGVYAAVSVETGGLWAASAFQYEKVQPEVRAYLPLWRRAVLAGRVQFGQLFVQGDLGSPITRRFYLGGPGSHRGFTYNRLAPQVDSGQTGIPPIPIGGDQMLLIQGELRADFAHLGSSWLGAVLFFDAGDVASASCASDSTCAPAAGSSLAFATIDLRRLHLAAGGGLRLKTELGTLRLDVGVRLNRLEPPNPDANQPVVLHLSLGEAF
jgi:translocation and assembly module TamA